MIKAKFAARAVEEVAFPYSSADFASYS